MKLKHHMGSRVTCSRALLMAAAIAVLCATQPAAHALISFDKFTWDAPGDTLGWFITNASHTVALTSTASGGVPASSGFLEATFNPGGNPIIAPQTASIVLNHPNYLGDYPGNFVGGVTFNFLGFPGSPQAFFFQTSAGTIWSYDLITPTRSLANNLFDVNLRSQGSFNRIAGAETFSDALRDVSLVGFTVAHLDVSDPFTFGVDNWQFTAVPEPGALALGLTAALCVVVFYRRRRDEEDEASPANDTTAAV